MMSSRHSSRLWMAAAVGAVGVLAATSLRAQQSVGGFVLFEIPTAWTTERTSLVLAYRPTRWGGAQRIEARISSCFDTCADTQRTSRRGNDPRATKRR